METRNPALPRECHESFTARKPAQIGSTDYLFGARDTDKQTFNVNNT